MTTTAVPTLAGYFEARAKDFADRCTRCGKCVEVCPILHSRHTPLAPSDPAGVIGSVVDFLRGQPLTASGRAWAEACMGSGECITHCPEHLNPRLVLGITLSRLRATESERGANAQAGFFKRMSQVINLAAGMQMAPALFRHLIGKDNRSTADVVMYIGCNVLRTPVIVFSIMDILDRLGVDYAMLGGTANCCGLVHMKLEGDLEGSEAIATHTLDKLAALRPRLVLQWCPSCTLQFTETLSGFRPYPFAFQHFSEYLVGRLDDLRPLLRPVPLRVALHRHEAGLGVYANVAKLLAAIPGLEVTPIEEQHHLAYSCGPGALSNVTAARADAHAQTVRSAVDRGADVLLTLYHTCHRDLCAFEGRSPLQVKNWTTLLATALGLPEHDDGYKRFKLHDDVEAILGDAREFIAANGLDVDGLRQMLPKLLEGKDRGLCVW